MNKIIRSSERGDAMAVGFAVVVVALVAALGFIFWQNFIKKDDTKTTDETSQTTDKPVEVKNGLVISEWSVNLPYEKSDIINGNELAYVNVTDEGYGADAINIMPNDPKFMEGGSCAGALDAVVFHGKADDTIPAPGDQPLYFKDNGTKVGDYYVVQGPAGPGACDDKAFTDQVAEDFYDKVIPNMIKNATEAK